MNICVFLRLTQTYNNEPVKVSCIHLERFKCAVRFVVAEQTIHTKTNKHIFFHALRCVRALHFENPKSESKENLYDVCCRHEKSVPSIFTHFMCQFQPLRFVWFRSSFDRFVCIPILLCCRHQHLIKIESKNGSVQMQTPLFTKEKE